VTNPCSFSALREAQDAGTTAQFWRNENPVCPHCGQVIDIAAHDLWDLCKEDLHDVECPFCDSEFAVVTSVTVAFSTDDQEDM
jgi:hypothetical protein